ncbi:sensor histidine kinase [Microbispora sp. NPDC088329]|uniref:sensor histidine kinase n=1 Tax=Microbispora sp. NPDC088329 TaxID=3154869 RepID=UPI00342497CA
MSLTALWAFAAWVTVRDGVNLLWVAVYNNGLVKPGETLLLELQQERRLSAVHVGNPSLADRQTLAVQRAHTNAAVAEFRALASAGDVKFASSEALDKRIAEVFRQLDDLGSGRKAIDEGRVDALQAIGVYTEVIDSFYRMYDSLAVLDDEQIAKDTRTITKLNRAREFLSQEDAVLSGALAAGRFGGGQPRQFVQLVGLQRFYTMDGTAELPRADMQTHEDLAKSANSVRLRQMEDLVMQTGRAQGAPPVTYEQWTPVVKAALDARIAAVHKAGDALVDRATSVSVAVVARLLLAGVLGLVAVIASIILSVTTARALVRQLEKLREAALELANERLPGVVARLAQGEKVDVKAEAPPLDFGPDVIGQVGAAFNTVQETAIRTAVEEAQLRQSIRDILLSLARRTQSLVHRQLTLLDVMERRESDPAELKDLFRIDHLATRMRRNAENLIVLAGASPARAWRRSVPMVDVVRGALAEVEDYTRVTVIPMGQTALNGRAVGDVIHLLAELIENAVSFSPPYTTVQVGGQTVASGYAIEIEDRGLGMSAEDLEATNQRIADPPEFNLSSTARLGLYVVSRLAERHGIKVSLKASPYGGTTAVVLLPRDLVIEGGEDLPEEETGSGLARRSRGGRRIALVGAPGAGPEPVQEVVPVPRAPEPPRLVPSAPLPGGDGVSGDDGLSGGNGPDEPVPTAGFTPSGLPFRVPQANLAPALAEEPRRRGGTEDEEDRSPEDIRKIMGSFQSGTRRGRSEAAKLLADEEDNL